MAAAAAPEAIFEEGNKGKLAADVLGGLRAYLEDEDFLLDIACWTWEHCPKFSYEPVNKWEHPLHLTFLHNEYRELFESRTDEFLEVEGVDLKSVLDGVGDELRDNPGDMKALLDSLTASQDYILFCKYMQNVRTRRDWAEGKDLQDQATVREPSPDAEAEEGDSSASGGRQPRGRPGSGLAPVQEEEADGTSPIGKGRAGASLNHLE